MPLTDRFHLALDGLMPPRRALFLRATPGGLADRLGPEVLICEQGYRPLHDQLASRGYQVQADVADDGFPLVAVNATASREETLGLAARGLAALGPQGTLLLNADKAEGADSLLKHLKQALPLTAHWSKAHGRLIRIDAPARAPSAWTEALLPRKNRDGWLTVPGIFSQDHADPGSRLLAGAVRGRLAGRVADLGAGWGYLAGEAFRDSPEIAELHLLEAEFSALQCARANVSDPRARFHWTDVIANPGEGGFDAVLCNPPFHSGKSTETSLGAGFIQAARRLLAPKGTAWFVANSHLPYEAVLNAAFARVEPLPRQGGYKIFAASLPRRP